MREILSRLRAALTPQAAALFALLALIAWYLSSDAGHAQSLEERIAHTLCSVEGAGKVEVTIRMKEIDSLGGAFGTQKTQSVPCGAVAVAQGADDPLVAIALREALCALLGLPSSSVSVITGGK